MEPRGSGAIGGGEAVVNDLPEVSRVRPGLQLVLETEIEVKSISGSAGDSAVLLELAGLGIGNGSKGALATFLGKTDSSNTTSRE